MKRTDWTNWARAYGSDFMRSYGEWLQGRFAVLPDDLIQVLASEFCLKASRNSK